MNINEKTNNYIVCTLIIGVLLVLLFINNKENDVLNNTSVIIVKTTNDDGSFNENKITNKSNINRIIEMIDDNKEYYEIDSKALLELIS